LRTVGQVGIVLNPDKFQFARHTVDSAEFCISKSTVELLLKYTDLYISAAAQELICNFPTPSSTTDIRSWFSLVNQVSS